MNPLEGFLYGLSVAATPVNLLAALVGSLLGTAIGVLPAFGPVAGAAVLLPLTYSLSPVTGLITLAAMFYGSMYGGSTTSILVNIPGETASVMTAIEGHQMTKKGRGGAALAVVAVGSFVAGTLGAIGVLLFAPLLASFALSFGSPDYFALTSVGLIVLAGITGGSFARSLFLTAFGLMLSTVGLEAITAVRRFDFGVLGLAQGIDLVPTVVGLFGVSEVLFLMENLVGAAKVKGVKLRELFPNRQEWLRSIPAWLRGTGVGFVMGVLPGPSATLSTFLSYRIEKAVSRRKEEFGRGAVEGVAGPEAANNAAATASLVPLLSLGIPFSPVIALLVAAMMVQGVQPGPLLLIKHPEIFWGILGSMYVANLMLVVLNLPLIGMWVSMLRVPLHLLVPAIVSFALIGAYSVRNSLFDLWVLLGFGILGYLLRKLDFELAPLVIAVVLGPMIEKHMRESLFLSSGSLGIFVGSPIAVAIWLLGFLVLASRLRGRLARRPATIPAASSSHEQESVPR